MANNYPQNPDKEIKGVKMVHARLNGVYEMYVPKHRADRPEWYTPKGWERKRLASMHRNLGEGDVIYYVGSEEGEMPALCQMWGAKVVMFEPNDKAWANTKAIWDANNLTPPLATFQGFAANNTSEKTPVLLDGFPASAEGEIIPDHAFKELIDPGDIPQLKIDDLVSSELVPPPTALTMDVEGSEWEVLQGAEQTLRKYRPKIWLSLHPEFLFRMFNKYSYEVRRWLIDMGYEEELLDYQHEAHFYYHVKS